MSVILLEELDNLVNEYKNATTRTDRLIKRRLDAIVNCYEECSVEEREFADEITIEFCRLISIMKEQHQKELVELSNDRDNLNYSQENDLLRFKEYTREKTSFYNGTELLEAFYNHFIKTESSLTLTDYKARINTFANKYLDDMLRKDLEYRDPVLFIYDNIEYILAIFKTTDENGKSIKQLVNIRSALRKLNDFKHKEDIK